MADRTPPADNGLPPTSLMEQAMLAHHTYIEHVAAPDPFGEVGNVTWWRLAECAWCAERYDRTLTPREDPT